MVGEDLGDHLVDGELPSDDLGGRAAVAGQHHDANALVVEGAHRLWRAVLDRVGHTQETGGPPVDQHEDHRLRVLAQVLGARREGRSINAQLRQQQAVTSRDGVTLPDRDPCVIWAGVSVLRPDGKGKYEKRIRAVTFGKVTIDLPNWDFIALPNVDGNAEAERRRAA